MEVNIDGKIPIDIKGPKISGNIPGIDIKGPNLDTNISGEIPGIDIKGPKISGEIPGIDIKGPNLDTNINGNIPGINIPNVDINLGFDNRIDPSLTLHKICSGDINDNIKLNVRKQDLWGINDFNLSGYIDGKLPSGNIHINGPNINIPNINLRGKKPDINIDGKMPNVDLNIKKPNINIPGVDINIKGPKFKEEFNSITLKEICNRDIYDPIHLNVNVKPFNSFINNIKGAIPQIDSNINKQNVNFDENIEIGEVPNNNSPNINLSSYATKTNKSIRMSDFDSNTRKTLQASISANIIGSSYNPFYNRKTIDVKASPYNSMIGNYYRKTEYGNNRNKFNNTITLKELFSRDVKDTVKINKTAKSIKLSNSSNFQNKSQVSYENQIGHNNSIAINLKKDQSDNKINLGLNSDLNLKKSYKSNKREQNPFKSSKIGRAHV